MGEVEKDMVKILMIVSVYLILVLIAPYILKGPDEFEEVPPNVSNPLGTDELGRDVLALIWKGNLSLTVFSLFVSVVALVIASFTTFITTFNREFETFISLLENAVLGFPTLVTLIFVMGILFEDLESRETAIYITASIIAWMMCFKNLKGRFDEIRSSSYVSAAISLGRKKLSIFVFHYIPNSVENLISCFFDILRFSISVYITLGFLGFGVPGSIGEQINLNFLRTMGNLKFFDIVNVFSAPFVPILVKIGFLKFRDLWMNTWAFLAPLGYSLWILFLFYALRKSVEKFIRKIL